MPTRADPAALEAPERVAPAATFHARVAGVGLITTVVVLIAACLTFMLQQWAVARTQSHKFHEGLAEVAAQMAAPSFSGAAPAALGGAFNSLRASPEVVSGRIVDASGKEVAAFQNRSIHPESVETISKNVVQDGRKVGELSLVVTQPSLAPMLPQFIALTFVLLFGGVGVALFLARSLAHGVIRPVQTLSSAMHDVAAGGSFTPVEPDAGDELFQSLTDSFNHLLAKLGEREDDLKGAMRDLEVARDAANAANVLKTQFLANMSHEIRTPLNGVLAMAEVMAMGDLAPVQRDRLDVIRRSGDLLLSVLNDVLDLSKIEAGKLTLFEEDFEVDEAIRQTFETFQPMAEAKGVAFALTLDEDARGWWRGDADRIRQIVGNLMSNAVKFTAQGTVSAHVSRNAVGGLRIVVSDTGVGIPAEKIPTLFEKFVQADNSATRRFGGTGLGLAICRELTQMMGGAIRVDSVEGEGSTFTLDLPLKRGGPGADGETAETADNETGLRVLAAEDNPTNQQVLAAVLSSLGIDVRMVPNGREAVEAWRTGVYDLILMDIQMPLMDGVTAALKIREAETATGRKRTPIIALTANGLPQQITEYFDAGMDAHVAKPIEIARLYDAISQVMTAAAAGQAPPRLISLAG